MIQQITPPNSYSTQFNISRKRSAGLDVVRTIACLTVIGSHFFLYTDFNSSQFSGVSMFLQGMLSSIAIGSDLYMILTGFLCCHKTLNRKFYQSGIKVILSYVFFSLITIAVNVHLFHTGMTWTSGLLGILSFSTIPYAWYIEMWIGLFLMAPFLNIWYKALPSNNVKLRLILLLFALSAFPDFFNRYGFYIMPQYWENVYPLAFYFTGCYIRENKPILPKRIILTIALFITLISPSITLISGHQTFLHIIGDRNGIFIATLAILIFLTVYDLDIKSDLLKRWFKMISLRSLDIFLCSAILDYYLYPLFKSHYYINQSQYGIFYFVIIPLIFTICYLIASIKRIFFNIIDKILNATGISITLQSQG